MNKRTAIIHIGTCKTGTTTIQHFLFKNRHVLKKRGVSITTTQWGTAKYTGFRTAAYVPATRQSLPYLPTAGLVRRGLFWEKITPEHQDRKLKKIRRMIETRQRNADLIIFSDEVLSAFREEETKNIKELMDLLFDEVIIILYLRRQPELLVSGYYTLITSGMSLSFDDYVNMPDEISFLAYRKIVESWSVFGKENIKVRVFDKKEFHENDLLSDFAAVAGLDTAGLVRVKNENISSLDSASIEFMRQLNFYCPKMEKSLVPSTDRSTLGRVFKRALAKNEKAYHLDRERARRILESHREDNDWIAREYLGRENLFNEDVSMYPEEVVSPHHLTVERCVELTAGLWKESGSFPFLLERLVRNFLERPVRYFCQKCYKMFKCR